MQQLAFEFYAPYGICEECLDRPVWNQKRCLCQPCYGRWYRETQVKPKLIKPTLLKIKPKSSKKVKLHKPGHSVMWCRKRAIERYGPDIINDLKAIKTRQYWTLTQVGEKYGFSREYARQLFKRLFGKDATIYIKQKSTARKKDVSSLRCNNDPRHKVADYKPGSV